MVPTTLVPQPLEKRGKKNDHKTFSKKWGIFPGPQKVHPLHRKLHLQVLLIDRLTTQDIINSSIRKSACQKHLSYQTRWKEYCAEKTIIYDSSAVEQFLNFFTELFSQRVSVLSKCSDLCKKCNRTCILNEILAHSSSPVSNKIFQRVI